MDLADDWQGRLDTLAWQDAHILENQQWTDCTFIVGEEGHTKEIKCHSVYLAKTSPVFAAMFEGGLKEKDGVYRVEDVTPKVFEALLEYIYCSDSDGEIFFTNSSVAFGFLKAAKKYLFPSSTFDACRKFIIDNMYPNLVWNALEFAKEDEESEVHNKAIMFLQNFTDDLLKTPGFLDVPLSVLKTLVRQRHLNCTEVHLYDACLCWGRNELKRQGKDDEDLKELLKPIIKYIRFLTMKAHEIMQGPVKDKIVSESDSLCVATEIANKKMQEYPQYLCNVNDPRNVRFIDNNESFMAKISSLIQFTRKISEPHIDFNEILQMQSVAVMHFCSSWNHIGVCVPTQIQSDESVEATYDENLSIVLYDYGKKQFLSQTNFSANVKYDSIINVPYKKAVRLPVNSTILVQLVFHTPGRYQAKLKRTASTNLYYEDRSFQANDVKEKLARYFNVLSFRCIQFVVSCDKRSV